MLAITILAISDIFDSPLLRVFRPFGLLRLVTQLATLKRDRGAVDYSLAICRILVESVAGRAPQSFLSLDDITLIQ